MQFVFNYPNWYIALCLLVAVVFAIALYVRAKSYADTHFGLRILMAFLRGTGVFIICLLLLSPLISSVEKTTEKPVIILATDNSQSLVGLPDSTEIRGRFTNELNDFATALSAKYQTDRFLFGEQLRQGDSPDYTDLETDLSAVFGGLFNRYYNRNIGAIIISSDGIFNKGQDPTYLVERFPGVPMYFIAMGDTTVRRDAMIEKTNANRTAFLGNEFPIEVLIKANGLKGKNTRLQVKRSGKVLKDVPVVYNEDRFLDAISVTLEADAPGLQHYVVELLEVEGEYTKANNVADVYVQVISSRQNILILAHSPHPDLGPMREVLEGNRNYKVTLAMAGDFAPGAEKYSLIVLHQIPSRTHQMTDFLQRQKTAQVPLLAIAGAQSDFAALSKLGLGVEVQGYRNSFDAVQPQLSDGFTLFTLKSEHIQKLTDLPPVHVPFAAWKFSPGMQPLFMQKLGRVTKTEPLIALNVVNNIRYGIISGEGTWRWKIKQPELYQDIFGKLFQYLTTKQNTDPFRVYTADQHQENQQVIFEAEVYNETYELITEPRVGLLLTNEEGKEFPYDFQVQGKNYRLDAGKLPRGTYKYKATANIFGKTHVQTGEFSVNAIHLESMNTVADHRLLHNMAASTGGAVFYPNEIDNLREQLLADEIPGIIYEESTFEPVLEWRWLFFILAFIFAAEWFMRKRLGGY